MRLPRIPVWIYPALFLIAGIGFQIWSFSQSGAADAYRSAPECATETTSGCYQVFPGQITSVQVRQTRDGERDDVTIQTSSHGAVTATLEPSAASAPAVRTGADVTVELYQGQVTLVEVGSTGVPSTANPVANQGDASFNGWLLIAVGALGFGWPAYTRWRRKTAAASLQVGAGGIALPPTQLESEILASGVGWSVRPLRNLATVGRYGFVAGVLLLMTYPAIVDPARTIWALLLDSVVILGMVALVILFLRNDRVFADRENVGKTDLLGRTVSIPIRDVVHADRFSVASRYGRNKHLVFVGADGRKAFEAGGPNWDYSRLDQLCEAAGITLAGSYDDLVGAFNLNERVPGTTRMGQQLIMFLAVLVVIVAVVVLLDGPGKR